MFVACEQQNTPPPEPPPAPPDMTTEPPPPSPITLEELPIAGSETPTMPTGNLLTAGVTYEAEIVTSEGTMKVLLYDDEAPITVESFIRLAQLGFYDGLTFHRIIANFVIQGGDPLGNGTGGPGYQFDTEPHPNLSHNAPGILSMANAGPGTNGSQFFILLSRQTHLDTYERGAPKNCEMVGVACHTVFGIVTEGLEVLNSLGTMERDPNTATEPGPTIEKITISIK